MMDIEQIKRLIDAAGERYHRLNPVVQKVINVGGPATVGALLGSISLGKDSSGKKRGYLLAGDSKARSIIMGALAGAMAGNHIPLGKTASFNNNETSIKDTEMSRQSCIDGAIKMAALKKLAWNENNDSAGIGSWNHNALGRAQTITPGKEWVTSPLDGSTLPSADDSYYGRLLANAKKGPDGGKAALGVLNSVAPRVYPGEPDHDITNPELADIRATQADIAARRHFGGDEGIKKYLIERGESNLKDYLWNEKVNYSPVDMPRLNKLMNGRKLTPGQLKILESIQNSMSMRGSGQPAVAQKKNMIA